MKNYTRTEKLDIVLEYVNKLDQPPFRKIEQMQKELKDKASIDDKEMFEILNKLVKDDNAIMAIDDSGIACYYSTFEGQHFGTYKNFNENLILKNASDLRKYKDQVRRDCYIIFGSWGAAIGTAALAIIEILKQFVWSQPCH